MRIKRVGSTGSDRGEIQLINRILSDGHSVELGPGDLYLDEPILFPEHGGGLLSTYGSDHTRLLQGWTSGADADDANNYMIGAIGSIDSDTIDTVLTNAATPGGADWYGAGSRAVSVEDPGAIFAGMIVAIAGHSEQAGVSPGGSNGWGVDYYNMARVASVGDGLIELAWPTFNYHDVGAGGVGGGGPKTPRSVRRVNPVRNVRLRGISLCAVDGTAAVGLALQYAMGVRLDDVRVDGFSRAGIEVSFGSMAIDMDRIIKGDQCTCAVLVRGGHSGRIDRLMTDPTVESLAHEDGLRRAVLVFEHGSTDWTVVAPHIRRAVQGLSFRGGHRISVSAAIIADCDIRMQDTGDGYHSSALRGSGISSGDGEGRDDEYVGVVNIDGAIVSNCRWPDGTNPSTNDPLAFSVCAHDFHNGRWAGIRVMYDLAPHSVVGGDSDYEGYGIGVQDASVQLVDCEVKGGQYGFAIRSSAGVRVTGCRHVSAPSTGTNVGSTISFWIADGNGLLVEGGDFDGYIWYGTPDGSSTHKELTEWTGKFRFNEEYVEGPLRTGTNDTGEAVSHGAVVAITGDWNPATLTGSRLVGLVAAESKALAQIVGRHGLSGYPDGETCTYKALPGSGGQVLVDGAVSGAGVLIEAVPDSIHAVVGTVVNALTLGVSQHGKAAGIGLVDIEPVSQ